MDTRTGLALTFNQGLCAELQGTNEAILLYTPFLQPAVENTEGRTSNSHVFPRKIKEGEHAARFRFLRVKKQENTWDDTLLSSQILLTPRHSLSRKLFCLGTHDPWLKAKALTDSRYWAVRVRRISITLMMKKLSSILIFLQHLTEVHFLLEFGICHVYAAPTRAISNAKQSDIIAKKAILKKTRLISKQSEISAFHLFGCFSTCRVEDFVLLLSY